jgi:hypothetical protein
VVVVDDTSSSVELKSDSEMDSSACYYNNWVGQIVPTYSAHNLVERYY